LQLNSIETSLYCPKAVFTLRTTSDYTGRDIVRCRRMSCAVWTPLKINRTRLDALKHLAGSVVRRQV